MNPYSIHFEDQQRTNMDVAPTTEAWRERGFYPVVSREGSPEQRRLDSLLSHILEAGDRENQPGFSRQAQMPLYGERFNHSCPATPAALDDYLSQNPGAGMPFGLPALEAEDSATLQNWIGAGAPGPAESDLKAAKEPGNPAAVAAWEAFFNGPGDKERLVARYIFKHVFLARIALAESPGEVFRLLRSATPPGEPVEIIDTDLPYDDPLARAGAQAGVQAGVAGFHYRLDKVTEPIVQKNHFVWHLAQEDIAHLKTLFFSEPWNDAASLTPPWGVGNPFQVFEAIPPAARYRFLLENAELIISGITYGPVCLGQAATFAIKDHFWLFFVDPAQDVTVQDPKLGQKTWDVFMDPLLHGNRDYQAAFGAALADLKPEGYGIDAVWDGGRTNPNAWLTLLRHETNVSVMKGRQGGRPRSLWLMDYSGFERIYYDTVANFRYWAGDPAKLETLAFFDFLRHEFEDSFLLLLPPEARQEVRHAWKRGIGGLALEALPLAGADQPVQIETGGRDPVGDLIDLIQAHMGPAVSGPKDNLNPEAKPEADLNAAIESYDGWVAAAAQLTVTTAYRFPRYLPSVILLRLRHAGETRVYSLVVNRVYETHDTFVFENGVAQPELNTLSIYPGVIGGFPNLFIDLDLKDAAGFLRGLRDVETLEDWNRLRDRYATLRNSADFWPLYDWFNAWNEETRGIDAGLLDLSYYDLFDTVY